MFVIHGNTCFLFRSLISTLIKNLCLKDRIFIRKRRSNFKLIFLRKEDQFLNYAVIILFRFLILLLLAHFLCKASLTLFWADVSILPGKELFVIDLCKVYCLVYG